MKIRLPKGREQAQGHPIVGACYEPSTQRVLVVSADSPQLVKRLSQSQLEEEPLTCSEIRVAAPGHSASTERFEGTTFTHGSSEEELNLEILQHLSGKGSVEAADWSRSASGVVALTTVEPTALEDAVLFAHQLAGVAPPLGPRSSSDPAHGIAHSPEGSADDARPLVRVETPMRALARFWLESHWQQARQIQGCAFVLIDSRACGVAFWSPASGLLHETEQEFPEDDDLIADDPSRHAGNIVFSLLTPASLETIGIEALSLLVIAGEQEAVSKLRERFVARGDNTVRALNANESPGRPRISQARIARELVAYNEQLIDLEVTGLTDSFGIPLSPYEAIARGLVGSPDVLPLINLAESLEERQLRIAQVREAAHVAVKRQAASRASLALFAPIIALVAYICGSALVLNFQAASLDARLGVENAKAQKLAHVRELRRAAGERLKWFIDVNNQILKIRGQQPAAVSLLLDLNQRWPQRDPSWRVTSLKAQGTGAVEITGVTEHEESVRALATALEFGGGFSGLQPEIKSDTKPEALASQSPDGEPAAPHRYSFTIRATYGPFVGLSVPPRDVADPTQSHFPPAPTPQVMVTNSPAPRDTQAGKHDGGHQ